MLNSATSPLDPHHDTHAHPTGCKRLLFTTNHKDIGTLYLILSFTLFFIGGAMAMLIRAELLKHGTFLISPEFFN